MNDELIGRFKACRRLGMSRRHLVALVVASALGGGEALLPLEPGEAKRRQKRRRRKNKKNRGPNCQPEESQCGEKQCCASGQQCLGATFGCVNGALQPGDACDPEVPLACASGECGCKGTDCFCLYAICAPAGVSCFIDLDCCTGFCLGAAACQESVSV